MKHFIVWSMVLCSYTFTASAINALTGTTYDRIAHQKNTSHPEIKPFVSAYGNLRAEPRTDIISLYFQYNVPSDKLTLSNTDSGRIAGETAANIIANGQATADALLKLQTGTDSTGAASVETKAAVNYVPGHEIMTFFTAIFTGTAAANNTRYIGIFNANNGFAIGYNGTSFGILHRKGDPLATPSIAVADTTVTQANFNLDPLDGTGPSGFILDPSKLNIFYISFGWLGTAPIEFAVMREDGLWIPFHKIQSPNDATVPTLYNPSLPIRAEVTNAGNETDLGLHTASWNAGFTGFMKANREWTYSLAETSVQNTTIYPLVFRNKATYHTKTSTARCRLLYINVAGRTANNTLTIKLYKNPTWSSAPNYGNDVDTNFSVMEYDTTSFTPNDLGTLVFSADVYAQSKIMIFFIPNNIFINLYPGDELLVAITETINTTINFKCSIGWEEYY